MTKKPLNSETLDESSVSAAGQEPKDLFEEESLSEDYRRRHPKAPKKKKKGIIVIGVLCVILACCLGVLYFHFHQTESKNDELKIAEQEQLQNYTTLINSASAPEGWDPAVFEQLKAQALNAYDQSVVQLFERADAGDEAAKDQVRLIETVSVQPAADKYRTLFSSLASYPAYAANILVNDPSMIDFVLDLPNHADGSAQDADLTESLDTVPDLKTADARWAYVPYGSGVIASDGSAPTAIAEVFSYLAKNPAITPYRVAEWARQYGYDVTPESENDSIFGGAALTWGVPMIPLMPYQQPIEDSLNYGNLIIYSTGEGAARKYYVITGRDENGNWMVQDPSSSAPATAIAPESIKDLIQSAYAFYG